MSCAAVIMVMVHPGALHVLFVHGVPPTAIVALEDEEMKSTEAASGGGFENNRFEASAALYSTLMNAQAETGAGGLPR